MNMTDYDKDSPDARLTGEHDPNAAVARARELLAASPYEPIGSEQAEFDAKMRARQSSYGDPQ
jgi:hypothetical protein